MCRCFVRGHWKIVINRITSYNVCYTKLLRETLTSYMKQEKPYLNEDCTLQYIAEQTGISGHHLSNVLNNKLKKSFSDFINEYRIEESKEILKASNDNNLTIEAVGFECGFGSKSSFNKVFKRHTQLTPSQYRQKHKS